MPSNVTHVTQKHEKLTPPENHGSIFITIFSPKLDIMCLASHQIWSHTQKKISVKATRSVARDDQTTIKSHIFLSKGVDMTLRSQHNTPCRVYVIHCGPRGFASANQSHRFPLLESAWLLYGSQSYFHYKKESGKRYHRESLWPSIILMIQESNNQSRDVSFWCLNNSFEESLLYDYEKSQGKIS